MRHRSSTKGETCAARPAGRLVQCDDGLWSIGRDSQGPLARTQEGKESGWKARPPGPVAGFATTSQPYWTILLPWGPGLTIPRNQQRERFNGARPFWPPGSTSWTSSMVRAASAPKFRPDPLFPHHDSPVRREPGGAWPPTQRRVMWPPLQPGVGGWRLSRSARVRCSLDCRSIRPHERYRTVAACAATSVWKPG